MGFAQREGFAQRNPILHNGTGEAVNPDYCAGNGSSGGCLPTDKRTTPVGTPEPGNILCMSTFIFAMWFSSNHLVNGIARGGNEFISLSLIEIAVPVHPSIPNIPAQSLGHGVHLIPDCWITSSKSEEKMDASPSALLGLNWSSTFGNDCNSANSDCFCGFVSRRCQSGARFPLLPSAGAGYRNILRNPFLIGSKKEAILRPVPRSSVPRINVSAQKPLFPSWEKIPRRIRLLGSVRTICQTGRPISSTTSIASLSWFICQRGGGSTSVESIILATLSPSLKQRSKESSQCLTAIIIGPGGGPLSHGHGPNGAFPSLSTIMFTPFAPSPDPSESDTCVRRIVNRFRAGTVSAAGAAESDGAVDEDSVVVAFGSVAAAAGKTEGVRLGDVVAFADASAGAGAAVKALYQSTARMKKQITVAVIGPLNRSSTSDVGIVPPAGKTNGQASQTKNTVMRIQQMVAIAVRAFVLGQCSK